MLLPGIVNSDLHAAKIVKECLHQFSKKGDYSQQSISLACNIQTSEALEKEVEKSKGYIARAEGQAQAVEATQGSGLLAALEV